jgi:RNA polymerase sigma-70 factor, ECF subfamily
MTCSEPSTPADRLANEQRAIAALKRGNIAGLAVLVQTYQVEAVHAALLIVGDRGTAEEVVQDAFLQAYRKIYQFDDRRPFGPWFLRSVIHAALKTAARQKRAEPLEEPQESSRAAEWPRPAGWPRTAGWLIDPGLGPQEFAEMAEMREVVWEALEQLTPDQRAAVVMRYFLDEGEAEMIRELNRPGSTVKWWLHAARQRLRGILRPFHAAELESEEASHDQE